MSFLRLKNLLFISRLVVGFCLFSAFVLSIQLLGLTWDAATGKAEVTLAVHTHSPNLFPAFHEAAAGYEDGSQHRPRRLHGPLPPLSPTATGFVLAADPQHPLLRYNETTAWKRVALLYLGASDELFSLSFILFITVGSWLLWRLLLDVRPTAPFTLANARRLAKLASLVLGLYLVQYFSYLALRFLVPDFHSLGMTEPLSHYVRLNTENTLPSCAVGIMLAVIAAVYRRGVELSQEAELTI